MRVIVGDDQAVIRLNLVMLVSDFIRVTQVRTFQTEKDLLALINSEIPNMVVAFGDPEIPKMVFFKKKITSEVPRQLPVNTNAARNYRGSYREEGKCKQCCGSYDFCLQCIMSIKSD